MFRVPSSMEFEELYHKGPQKGAVYALCVLTLINLINYADRFIPSSTKDLYKKDLQLSDAESSAPMTAFIVVYMFTSPIFAMLSDRGFSRRYLLMSGVILWSLATGLTFFAIDFWTFLSFRTLVGVGEAAYATIAPALLADLYPPDMRNRVMTIMSIAAPVGGAIGFTLGGILGQQISWRAAFLFCGIPGVFVALLIHRIRDPGVGTFETLENDSVPWLEVVKRLSRNKEYLFCLGGLTLHTWAVGALTDWLPTYIYRYNTDLDMETSAMIVGASVVVGGVGGTLTGSMIGDRLKEKMDNAYFAVSSVSLFLCGVFILLLMLFVRAHPAVVIALVFIGQIFAWFYLGPISAIQANCVEANIRARSFSLCILIMHLLGDGASPIIVGSISDHSSLFKGLILAPCMLMGAGLVFGVACFVVKKNDESTREYLLADDESFDSKLNDDEF
ncbi:major facilitator transporter [Planoprotostelium fungivorum]|uniref:Major facilitator transporter n=1 Tax=Planoprotostelium fungivorum TaxID=1890364 RepID=A0A2P6NA58_9EUKA|nr:major facilitator transporter [Planoprotostelium fungivorum]